MGKVFEALTRAEVNRDQAEELDAPAQSGAGANAGTRPERFSFVRYSLGAGSSSEPERQQTATAALMRRSESEPSREVTIDPTRVDPHLVSFYNFDPAASRQFDQLALSLISKAAERGFKRVLIASALNGEGRTTVALNLACALARARQRVLVVDCDLIEPGVGRALGIDPELGLAEAFRRGLPAGTAAIRIRPYGFSVAPMRDRVENSVELLASPNFWQMLQQFDAGHDFVLFDSSPLLASGDSSLLIRFTDTTLLVVESGRLGSPELSKAMSPFTQDDILGVVINRIAGD
jgi:Mrp family chromosome partitioning ATPase